MWSATKPVTRLVLFGGSGFVGSAIRRGLHSDVVAPTRSEVDLVDVDRVRRFLAPGDVVINATGYASATDRSPVGLARLRRDNVQAVEALATAASDSGVAQLIHISSVAAMGHQEGSMITEAEIVEPRSPYGASKRDAERILDTYKSRLPVTILRPTSVFGEGRGLAAALCRIAALPIVPLPEGGRALVPFTYVRNVAEAVRLATGCERCLGRTFIVGDEDSYTLRALVEALARGLGKPEVRTIPVPAGVLRVLGAIESYVMRQRERPPLLDQARINTLTKSISYSIAALRSATGYIPPVGLEEATQRIASWYARERDQWS